MIATRKRLHELVDQIPAERISDVARYLEELIATDDPVLRAFGEATEDDEDVTPEERQAIDEAWVDIRKGRHPSK